MTREHTVSCPQCGAPVVWRPASRFRPFCSERCRTIDFGGWASESYRVPVAEERADPSETTGDEDAGPV
jgi:hypothetical protein